MLACRPRPAHRLSLSSSSSSSLPLFLAALVMVPLSLGCGPTADGGPVSGVGGSSGTSGGAGTTGAGGATAGTSGSAGTTGSAGRGGATAGTGGSSAGTSGGAGTGGGSAGTSGSAGTTGSAGSSAGRGGATAGTGGSSAGTGGGTAGTGGGSAGAGGTVVATTCNGGPPSAPAGGVNFPFPQHRASSNCIYPPTCSDADMTAGWTAYKTALIVADGTDGSMRVSRPSDGNDTVSEGISYGMLFAVYMNDKATFDALWKYEQKHLNTTHGLMHWHINSSGTTAGMNSATDADEDMAFALVMADKQWGGYTTTAINMLNTVAMYDFGTDGTIKGGDFYVAVNPSYIAPAFYRVFAAYHTDATQRTRWMTILDKSYEILAAVQNATSGLVPDWSAGPATNTSYGYDATRTPFRVALDACWSGDARAKTFSQKIGTFFAGQGVANIVDGYNVNGTKTGSNKNSTFIGPAGAAGMASNQTQLVADAYMRVAADAKAATTNYYDRSWALFTVMLMTGNFVNFQSP